MRRGFSKLQFTDFSVMVGRLNEEIRTAPNKLQARNVYSILIGKPVEEHGGLRNNIKRNGG